MRLNVSLAARQRQSGAVLVVGLIFLMVLTLLGTTAVQTATMEERMAGNNRDRNLAFQASESALRAAESYLRATALQEGDFNDDPTAGTAGTNPGLVAQIKPSTARPNDEPGKALYWRGYTWTVHSRQYGSDVANTAERPRYVVENMGTIPGPSASGGKPLPDANVYRITARGVGRSGAAVVYLQSTYIKQ